MQKMPRSYFGGGPKATYQEQVGGLKIELQEKEDEIAKLKEQADQLWRLLYLSE